MRTFEGQPRVGDSIVVAGNTYRLRGRSDSGFYVLQEPCSSERIFLLAAAYERAEWDALAGAWRIPVLSGSSTPPASPPPPKGSAGDGS